MKIEIHTLQDEQFKFINKVEQVELEDTTETPSVQEEAPKKDFKATLENPKGHRWFDGTSWGTN